MPLAQNPQTPAPLSLADLSMLPRWGIKGRGVRSSLLEQSFVLPSDNNRSAPQPDGSLIAQLSPSEVLVLSSPRTGRAAAGDWIETFSCAGADNCYPVSRIDTHAWFFMSGEATPGMFAKLCGVDLDPAQFENYRLAQTSVARLSAIIIRNDTPDNVAFSLLADSSSAEYLWECVLDAMEEFGGVVTANDFGASQNLNPRLENQTAPAATPAPSAKAEPK